MWAINATNCFTKKTKPVILLKTDNMMWSDSEIEVLKSVTPNKVFDEITEDEI